MTFIKYNMTNRLYFKAKVETLKCVCFERLLIMLQTSEYFYVLINRVSNVLKS